MYLTLVNFSVRLVHIEGGCIIHSRTRAAGGPRASYPRYVFSRLMFGPDYYNSTLPSNLTRCVCYIPGAAVSGPKRFLTDGSLPKMRRYPNVVGILFKFFVSTVSAVHLNPFFRPAFSFWGRNNV